jgi:hypothetical protein
VYKEGVMEDSTRRRNAGKKVFRRGYGQITTGQPADLQPFTHGRQSVLSPGRACPGVTYI